MQKRAVALLCAVASMGFVAISSAAMAQVGPAPVCPPVCPPLPPPPPPPPPPTPTPDPAPAPKADSGHHGGSRTKITGESIMLWQGISIGCSAVTTMAHAGVAARSQRELTPLEAVNDSARCTFIPAMLISLYAHMSGMKDNACTRVVARQAFKENNTPRAREELLWRDGSWERRQQKFLDAYAACYKSGMKVRRVTHKRRR